MKEKTKEKNWFQKHWIISIILVFFVIGIIGTIADIESNSQDTNYQTTKEDSIPKEYSNEDLTTLIIYFSSSSSPYTDLQKEEEFEKYKDKWINSSEIVSEVSDVMLSSNLVVATMNPTNQYLRGATIYFDESQKEKLLELSKYDTISFEGRIVDYGSLMGIIIKEAKVLD